MMYWDKTLTIFTPIDTDKRTWLKQKAVNCFYQCTKGRTWDNQNLKKQDSHIARIPLDKNGDLVICENSIVFIRDIAEVIPDNGNGKELLAKYDGFIIRSWKTNSIGFVGDHIYVRGD